MDRLVNALVQKGSAYRVFMNKLKETMDQKNKILSDTGPNDEVNSILYIAAMDRIKIEEDPYYIIVEKPKRGSETAQRVATVEPGQGILALMKVYAWYAGTTGLALKRRTEMVMSPHQQLGKRILLISSNIGPNKSECCQTTAQPINSPQHIKLRR